MRSCLGRLTALALLVFAGGCAPGAATAEQETVSVLAASSLTEAFQAVELALEAVHPGTDLVLSFAGSQALRLQLEQGARADVFASANATHMQALVDAEVITDSRLFAYNELALIEPQLAERPLSGFAELPRAERLVIGTPEVPIGGYTRDLLMRAEVAFGADFVAAVRASVVSEEMNVRLVRAKVALGEADAGIVYRSDALASDAVRLVPIPPGVQVRAAYHIGSVAGSTQPDGVARLLSFLGSEEGKQVLEDHGFSGAPR